MTMQSAVQDQARLLRYRRAQLAGSGVGTPLSGNQNSKNENGKPWITPQDVRKSAAKTAQDRPIARHFRKDRQHATTGALKAPMTFRRWEVGSAGREQVLRGESRWGARWARED